MIGTLVPAAGARLVLGNGAYGQRMIRIAERYGRAVRALETPENVPVSAAALDDALRADPSISHVTLVSCETTSGILNAVHEVAATAARHGRSVGEMEMRGVLHAIRDILEEMRVTRCGPRPAATVSP